MPRGAGLVSSSDASDRKAKAKSCGLCAILAANKAFVIS